MILVIKCIAFGVFYYFKNCNLIPSAPLKTVPTKNCASKTVPIKILPGIRGTV